MSGPLNKNYQSIDTEIDLSPTPEAKPVPAAVDPDPIIDVVDDTPEKDKGRSRQEPLQDAPKGIIPDDEELQQYSESVQKRMKRMTYEYHEQRRQREASDRQVEEASKIARNLYEDNQRLRQSLKSGEQNLVAQAKGRVDAQLMSAKEKLRKAHESGDTEALITAQEELSMLHANKMQVDQYQPQYQQEALPPIQQQARPQVAEPDYKTKEWASKNDWFQKDTEMTATAFGVHQRLVQEQGIDPRREPDVYYAELDKAMRKRFPDYEWADQRQAAPEAAPRRPQMSSVVAPATRTSPSVSADGRRVSLTASQVSLAKRLGLTPQQYAVELIKQVREQ